LYPEEGQFRRELYQKHIDFINAGADNKERAFFGANRSGKTTTILYEQACHLTGKYPTWFKGRVFSGDVNVWACGDTNETVRDILQEKLLGPINAIGTGLIPKDCILDYKIKPGVPNAIATAMIRRADGSTGYLAFKTYEQGRKAFQGTAVHSIALDEEPVDSTGIYSECLLRTMTTQGIISLGFTPLSGMSNTVLRFLKEGLFPENNKIVDDSGISRWISHVTWDDMPPHLSEGEKKKIIAALLPHEIEARVKGIPSCGTGKVYIVPEDDILCDPFNMPDNWPRSFGMDVGWVKTAAVWFAYDKTRDMWYLYDEYYTGQQQLETHALAIKKRGAWIPGVVDPSSKRSNDEGKKTFQEYRRHGLNIRLADNTVDAGILKLTELLSTGRLKIFKTCQNWLKEYRAYRRNESGDIADKQADHAMDATRYWMNSGLRIACTKPYIDEYITQMDGT
jgi:phage terminase large subunit-like protein